MTERLVAVRCPGLLVEDEHGRALRAFAAVMDALEDRCPWVVPVRCGICVLPARGPARYFGGEEAVVDLLLETASDVLAAHRPDPGDDDDPDLDLARWPVVEVGIAEGTFAAVLAAVGGVVVPPGATPAFLSSFPVGVLGDDDLADLLARLGIRTLGEFAALPRRHVLGRFGNDGVLRHQLAAGLHGSLPDLADPAGVRRLRALRERGGGRSPERQRGFWGEVREQDQRAALALARVADLLGAEGVLGARPTGGRSPAERVALVTWSAAETKAAILAGPRTGEAPWPGTIPPPAPALVHADPPPAELLDGRGAPVAVSGRGLLSGSPATLSVGNGPRTAVHAYAGPWVAEERWWTRHRSRQARLQVVTGPHARLLALARGRWRVEATYG